MGKKNLFEFLRMDSYNIEIPLSASKTDIICILKENGITISIPMDMSVVVKSTLFSLDIEFCIAFLFQEEILVSVMMSPCDFMEGKDLYSRYKQIQYALEKKLGKTTNCLWKIMNFFNPSASSMRWKTKDVFIEHYLFERFRMEEIISIQYLKRLPKCRC